MNESWKPTQAVFCHSSLPLLVEVVRALESHRVFGQVVCYSSCGNGCLLALMKYLGYSADDMEHFLAPYFEVDSGRSEEEILLEVIESVFQRLTVGVPNLKQIYLLTGKKLYFSCYNLTRDEIIYLSSDTHPTMSVADAILISVLGGRLVDECYLPSCSVEPLPLPCLPERKRTLVLQTQLTRDLFASHTELLHRAAIERLTVALFRGAKGVHLYLQVKSSKESAVGLTYAIEDLVEKSLQKITKANKKLLYSKEIFE